MSRRSRFGAAAIGLSIGFSGLVPRADAAQLWSPLPSNGSLSAGWVQVLPVLASSCNVRFDNGQLTRLLFDLSMRPRNEDYTWKLYTRLYEMQSHGRKNEFVRVWNAKFGKNQQDACKTAFDLWGPSGTQFQGILAQEAAPAVAPPTSLP